LGWAHDRSYNTHILQSINLTITHPRLWGVGKKSKTLEKYPNPQTDSTQTTIKLEIQNLILIATCHRNSDMRFESLASCDSGRTQRELLVDYSRGRLKEGPLPWESLDLEPVECGLSVDT